MLEYKLKVVFSLLINNGPLGHCGGQALANLKRKQQNAFF